MLDEFIIKINDIPFYCDSVDNLTRHILDTCNSGEKMNRLITATGGHGISLSRKDHRFANVLKNSYLNIPDGIPAVWIGRLKGKKGMKRLPGPDFFGHLIRNSAEQQLRHYFCGGKEGVADELREVCARKYCNSNIVGTFCPPFRTLEEEELKNLAADINGKNVDILWIGISTPKQELFAERLSFHINTHFVITVGAAFDFHTGRLKKAPILIQNVGLEWAFRVLMEPKRLYKRYSRTVPEVIFFGIKDLLQHIRLNGRKAVK